MLPLAPRVLRVLKSPQMFTWSSSIFAKPTYPPGEVNISRSCVSGRLRAWHFKPSHADGLLGRPAAQMTPGADAMREFVTSEPPSETNFLCRRSSSCQREIPRPGTCISASRPAESLQEALSKLVASLRHSATSSVARVSSLTPLMNSPHTRCLGYADASCKVTATPRDCRAMPRDNPASPPPAMVIGFFNGARLPVSAVRASGMIH